MWSELEADPPACAGGGRHAAKARLLPGGFPGGRALCLVCWGFVELSPDETLAAHDAFRGAGSEEEASSRAAWFNTYGWDRG
ncbi:hypothetical protein HLA99_12450 [Microbacterium ulmi]|uniref:Uncharacterized protein n=2 Tax=Microbacterium ulmi TaxID=179095 RepID=A0A7Y2M277_9MICO|nr:hypothetical protein [Microbacterium ulmi]